jgi:hypothetical protein
MRPSTFTRVGGLGALFGGLLWLLTLGLVQLVSTDLAGLMAVPAVLLAVGLVALQARHAASSGRLGLTAFAITLLGFALLAFGSVGEAVLTGEILGRSFGPVRFHGAAPGALLVGAGAALAALSAILAHVLPRLSPLPLLVGALGVAAAGGSALARQVLQGASADVVPFELLPLALLWALFGAGWLVLGYILWSERIPDVSWR